MRRAKVVKKEESEDLSVVFGDIDWSQVSQTQTDDAQVDPQFGTQPETQQETQAETQTTLIGGPALAKLAHKSVSPPVRTISTESGSSTQTNDSAKTLVVDDEDVDYRALLDGAENFDWDDWDTDDETNGVTTTPRKLKSPSKTKKFTPVKPKNLKGMAIAGGGGGLAITPPPYTKPCTRCIVVQAPDNKALYNQPRVSGLLHSLPPVLSALYCVERIILLPDARSSTRNPFRMVPSWGCGAGLCHEFSIGCWPLIAAVTDVNI